MSQSKLSYSAVAKSNTFPSLPAASYSSSDLPTSCVATHEKKLNVVLYGVQECPSGMSRSARQDSDLTNVLSVLSSIDPTIKSLLIIDCFKLGKFTQSTHLKPNLSGLLMHPDSPPNDLTFPLAPFLLKPHFPFQQCAQNFLLLKQGWQLIQKGIDHKFITIRGDCLYVCKKL